MKLTYDLRHSTAYLRICEKPANFSIPLRPPNC